MNAEQKKFSSSFSSDQFSDQFSILIDQQEIQSIIQSLAHTLNQKYKDQELILIGILKGSMIFMADLIRQISEVKVIVDFVQIKSQGRTKESQGSIIIEKDISTNIYDKNILIVEEIIDTARATNFLRKRIELSQPRSIEVITLIDKPYKRVVKFEANYIGKKINDQFVIGYGLDLDQTGRNLKDIYTLTYPN
jgi:hypoxanthine phosphoribosyltransferase